MKMLYSSCPPEMRDTLLHHTQETVKELTELCTCCAVYSIVNILMKEENLSLLLTLTKRQKTGASNEILSKIFYKLF